MIWAFFLSTPCHQEPKSGLRCSKRWRRWWLTMYEWEWRRDWLAPPPIDVWWFSLFLSSRRIVFLFVAPLWQEWRRRRADDNKRRRMTHSIYSYNDHDWYFLGGARRGSGTPESLLAASHAEWALLTGGEERPNVDDDPRRHFEENDNAACADGHEQRRTICRLFVAIWWKTPADAGWFMTRPWEWTQGAGGRRRSHGWRYRRSWRSWTAFPAPFLAPRHRRRRPWVSERGSHKTASFFSFCGNEIIAGPWRRSWRRIKDGRMIDANLGTTLCSARKSDTTTPGNVNGFQWRRTTGSVLWEKERRRKCPFCHVIERETTPAILIGAIIACIHSLGA